MADGPVLLILNGDAPDPELARGLAEEASLVVCADGGYRHALEAGLDVDWIVGDIDSIDGLELQKDLRVLFEPDQERSDFEKAVDFLTRSRFAAGERVDFLVLGALGGRRDHEMVNLQVAEARGADANFTLFGARETLALITGEGVFDVEPGQRVSLIPGASGARLSARGLKYPLRDERLERGSRGVSNEAVAGSVELDVTEGSVWAVFNS